MSDENPSKSNKRYSLVTQFWNEYLFKFEFFKKGIQVVENVPTQPVSPAQEHENRTFETRKETIPSTSDTKVLVNNPFIFASFVAQINVSDMYNQIIKGPSTKKSRLLYLSRTKHPVNPFNQYLYDNDLWGPLKYTKLEDSMIEDIKAFVKRHLLIKNEIFLDNLSKGIVDGNLRFNDNQIYNDYFDDKLRIQMERMELLSDSNDNFENLSTEKTLMNSERKKQMESGLDSNDDLFTEAEEKSIRRFI